MGIPTVANNIIGVKDAIENEVSGILVNKDESIIEKLFSLIENEDHLIDLKNNIKVACWRKILISRKFCTIFTQV